MGIKELSEKLLAEEIWLPELWINDIYTEAQKELQDKGTEMDDEPWEMINYD